MKTQVHLLLIFLAIGCQNRQEFSSHVDPLLVGKWELTAYETTIRGIKHWETRDSLTGEPSFIIRTDGVFVNRYEQGLCCGPIGRMSVNGKAVLFKAKSPIPRDEICTLVSCSGCSDHDFKVDQDELLWTKCGTQSRYRRLP